MRVSALAALRLVALAVVVLAVAVPRGSLSAQAHDHASGEAAPPPDARLQLLLGGPHLILYHRGLLALNDAQIAGLQRIRRAVCDAELTYVERTAQLRARLPELLGDSAPVRPTRLQETMAALASAESDWLGVLMRARRDALALLTAAQRTQVSALRDHWTREALAMIEESTRPGQRGHPGMQLPIRVPGMVVGATTLLPYCEQLHGPAMHLSVPPPSP